MNILPERIKETDGMTNSQKIAVIYDYIKGMRESLMHFSSAKHLDEIYEKLTALERRVEKLERGR